MMKKVIVAILMISILIFMVGCSKESKDGMEDGEIVLPDGTVLPPPEEAGPLPKPVPPPATSTPTPVLPGTEGESAQEPAADTTEVDESADELTEEPAEVTVQIKDLKFIPADLVVEKGTEVTWINLDSTAHTATSDEEYFDSGRLGNNEEFSFTFEEEGSWEYYCTFHPDMKANVIVE